MIVIHLTLDDDVREMMMVMVTSETYEGDCDDNDPLTSIQELQKYQVTEKMMIVIRELLTAVI